MKQDQDQDKDKTEKLYEAIRKVAKEYLNTYCSDWSFKNLPPAGTKKGEKWLVAKEQPLYKV